ncbi:ATP-dependent DNA helicase [Nocardioides sp. GXQ0305]|uniref:ATP-dependent DNA helicase n=1 Tax=Nocardioides sp. GXQ0305 TaxID=3423912 RepID=UPI003D7D7962
MTTRALRTPAELQQVMGTSWQASAQQWAAISAPLEPAVVVAGAGSGKTTLMAARVVYLVVTGQVRPDQVLGLTFTTKAAAELRSRIRAALEASGFARGVVGDDSPDGEEVLEPVVETYNAYAASLLTEHGLRIGHEPDTRVIADAARYQLAGRVIDRHTRPVTELSDSPPHVIAYLLALDSALAEHLVEPADLRAFDARERLLFEAELSGRTAEQVRSAFVRRGEALGLVDDYRATKRRLGLMDFSDQIALAARLADAHPDVGALERDKARVVLLDEYQDTSVAQALLLRRLFSGLDVATGRGHAVTAVGDPNQAIYGWRGASVSNILHFGDDFPAADGGAVPTHPLTVNRRSDVRILEVANRLAAPLHDAFTQVEPLEPGGDEPGEVQTVVHESYAGELGWLTDAVRGAHAAAPDRGWREIGVLVRDNDHAADVFDALTAADVPVEIVGLKGLLRLPEVAEVLAMLTLVHELTANSELLALLTGPRWAIGPRDLALLGRRARELADARQGRVTGGTVDEELGRAVAGADPTEVTALSDALDDPGDLPYSAAARERFGLLAGELRHLRAHSAEPLLELVRRIIDVCGIDVELAASVSEAARARRENLDLFVKAVAEFQAIDGAVTLPALLAWLEAEQDGEGLDVATPSTADSVKLLTVHRAKGLEWDTVFLVGVCEEKFPHTRSRGLWPTRVELLPTPLRGDRRDLPALLGHDKAALDDLKERSKAHEMTEELRLGYVAFTRARHRLLVSSYLWTEGRKTPLGPSPFQETVRQVLETWGEQPLAWHDKPEKGAPNPLQAAPRELPWPVTEQTAEALRRIDAVERVLAATGRPEPELDVVDAATVAEWDDELERLRAEAAAARADTVDVPRPASLSATAVARLRDDPDGFAADLARPMPRPPAPAARFGTRFHAWVENRFGQQDLIDPDDLPGRADAGIDDADDLRALTEAFEKGPFGDRVPHRIEAPFALVLAGQVVRGRIDAVYAENDGGYLVVDWKTSRRHDADPLQLALYRLAWAELTGTPVAKVRAGFCYVRSGDLVEPPDLPDRAELEQLLSSPAPP